MIKTIKSLYKIFAIIILAQSCDNKTELSSIDPVNWEKRTVKSEPRDSLTYDGTTYLSVYSQIYSQTEHRTYNLTATVSMRNTNKTDTLYINKAEYFDTKGNSIRTYFDKTIFIAPMETVEIIIDELDQQGGTGANFLFDWTIKQDSNDPIFEAVMISPFGLSFATQGKKIQPQKLIISHQNIFPNSGLFSEE